MITKATPADTGCWVDGHWGQYAIAHMIERAQEYGYADASVIDLATRKLATIGPRTESGLTLDEEESLSYSSDSVEAWFNDHVAPDGYSFGWMDGEFFLYPDTEWEAEYGDTPADR